MEERSEVMDATRSLTAAIVCLGTRCASQSCGGGSFHPVDTLKIAVGLILAPDDAVQRLIGVCKWASVTARPHNFVHFMKSVTVTDSRALFLQLVWSLITPVQRQTELRTDVQDVHLHALSHVILNG